tara:strand:+ start:977 stop:1531 length:555 start_codon:yes stop_codon:yes gene_type:complete
MNISEMVDQPVSTHKYGIYNVNKLPKAVLCVTVKNQYDERRLAIKNLYSPKYILHFQAGDRELIPLYYYGFEIRLEARYADMLKIINSTNFFGKDQNHSQSLKEYKNLLREFDLTCNTCYGYFADGVCPIDLFHLQKITSKDFSSVINSGLNSLLNKQTTREPIYKRVPNFNISILTKCTGYDS